LGEWYYTVTGVNTFTRRYLVHPPRLEAMIGDERVTGVSAIIQNAAPYTYFGSRPVEMAEGASLTSGGLAGLILERARPTDVPTIFWRALSKRARVTKHRHVHPFGGVGALTLRSLDDRPLPLQVDGDYIGDRTSVTLAAEPSALTIVA
jgi:diacylglycerol kinase family enzyme